MAVVEGQGAAPGGGARPIAPWSGGWAFLVAGAMVLFTACWITVHLGGLGRYQIQDTPQYQVWGEAMSHGRVPYRDFPIEYLPGALPAFAVPAWLSNGSHRSYEIVFEALMVLCGFVTIAAVAATLRRLGTGIRGAAERLGLLAVFPLLLGNVTVSRFDLLPAAFAACGVAATVGESPALAGALLGIGGAVKLYPILLAPFAAVYFARRSRRMAVRFIVSAIVAVAVVILPFFAIAPHGVLASIRAQASRPLQIEALGSSLALIAHQVYGQSLHVAFSYSWNLTGPTARLIASTQVIAQVALVIAVFVAFSRGPASGERLVRHAAAVLVAFVLFGKVLSPQYLIWLVPPVAIVVGRRWREAGELLAAALLVTHLYFPRRFGVLVRNFDSSATWMLAARNLLLVLLLLVLLRPSKKPDGAGFSVEQAA